jgi:hypothetical protein
MTIAWIALGFSLAAVIVALASAAITWRADRTVMELERQRQERNRRKREARARRKRENNGDTSTASHGGDNRDTANRQ